MKNRAKCKLCQTIIESCHPTDYVSCKCGEISLDGGIALKCYAKDFNNFLRVDDEGNEIVVKVKKESDVNPLYNEFLPQGNVLKSHKDEVNSSENVLKPNKKELIEMLDTMIKNYEDLPQNALASSVNHYDLISVLLLVSSIFRADCND